MMNGERGSLRGIGEMRRAFLGLAGVVVAAVLGACSGGGGTRQVRLPAPSDKTVIGPGDVFILEIVGEKELPREFQVASDGTADLPYVETLEVAGLEPQEIARVVRKILIDKKVLLNPIVIVQVKEYNSRRVILLGQVSKPGSYPLTAGHFARGRAHCHRQRRSREPHTQGGWHDSDRGLQRRPHHRRQGGRRALAGRRSHLRLRAPLLSLARSCPRRPSVGATGRESESDDGTKGRGRHPRERFLGTIR
jgi:hypothetical protein